VRYDVDVALSPSAPRGSGPMASVRKSGVATDRAAQHSESGPAISTTVARSSHIGRSEAFESQRTFLSGPGTSSIVSCQFQDLSPPLSFAKAGCSMTLDPKSELTRQWLQVAADDLSLAVLAHSADPPMLSGVVYHCQHTFEKTLKAYLVWHGQQVPRTHALPDLVVLCQQIDPGFASLAQSAAQVTPCGTAFRFTRSSP
jgi:hypothetical protein